VLRIHPEGLDSDNLFGTPFVREPTSPPPRIRTVQVASESRLVAVARDPLPRVVQVGAVTGSTGRSIHAQPRVIKVGAERREVRAIESKVLAGTGGPSS
jgi:hypothetical protein